jgi:hypothetical protein
LFTHRLLILKIPFIFIFYSPKRIIFIQSRRDASNSKIALLELIFMTLPKGHGQRPSTSGKRSFEDWWGTVPEDLRQKSRKGDEANKPLLNQVNYVLLHLHLAGKHDAKPTHEELRDWLHSGQVDVLRMGAAKK